MAKVLKAQTKAKSKGYADVLYVDSVDKFYLEEASSCNIFIVKSAGGDAYLLYVLTVSGIAYLLHLRRSFSYTSGSNIPASDVIEAVVIPHIGKITSVAATLGCLLTGHADGSIGCHQLGKVDPSAQGFMSELRDDMGSSVEPCVKVLFLIRDINQIERTWKFSANSLYIASKVRMAYTFGNKT